MASGASQGRLAIRPLTPARVDDVKQVTRGTWGSTCWDLWPRYTAAQQRERGLTDRGGDAKRRAELARLARKRNAPGLVAYRGKEPIGWVSIGPRVDYSRVDTSRATPPIDDLAVWVIPCITVRRGYRGQGVAISLIRAAVEYAGKRGAPAVEAYPRADNIRRHDDFAFYGTKAMFLRAGFRQVRGALRNLPKSWSPRVTMRRRAARGAGKGPDGARAG
jgi:GNAT superfamily N-acetyltransferase